MVAPLLAIRGIRKSFGGLHVLQGLTLDLEAAGVKCIIGPNGCGKSTLFNILTGVMRPDAGTVDVGGVPSQRMSASAIAKLGMLRKFQVPGVFHGLSVLENLEVAQAARGGGSVRATLRNPHAFDYLSALRGAGLYEHRAQLAEDLPHGLKQKLELLMLVSRGPRLLLLDEPTAGMTTQETVDVAQLIGRLSRDHGVAVLVIEHDMHFVRELACPVVVMLKGVVQREGSYDQVRHDPQVRAAYLGEMS